MNVLFASCMSVGEGVFVVLCVCCQSVLLVVLASGLSLVHELSSRSFCCRVRMIWW